MQNWGGKCLPPATLGWYGPGPLPQRGLLLLVAGPYRKPRRVGADSCSVDNRRGGRCQRGAQGWAVSPVWVCTWVCNCACVHVPMCTCVLGRGLGRFSLSTATSGSAWAPVFMQLVQ